MYGRNLWRPIPDPNGVPNGRSRTHVCIRTLLEFSPAAPQVVRVKVQTTVNAKPAMEAARAPKDHSSRSLYILFDPPDALQLPGKMDKCWYETGAIRILVSKPSDWVICTQKNEVPKGILLDGQVQTQ